MVNITFLELHFEDSSFSTGLPFGDSDTDDESTDESAPAEDSSSGVPTKAVAVLGVLLVLVGIGALVKHRSGDEPEVEIETAEDREESNRPVGVTLDE